MLAKLISGILKVDLILFKGNLFLGGSNGLHRVFNIDFRCSSCGS